MDRYARTVSEMKVLLTSKRAVDRQIVEETLQLCRRLPVGDDAAWRWILEEIPQRGKRIGRPVSCGQFDVLALCLDLVRLRRELDQEVSDLCAVFVVIDNPETYLHPACQVPALELVQEVLPDAQMFIASHSLRLLCWPNSKSVFWLSRDRQVDAGQVTIESVREFDEGARSAFLELYGDDVSSAIFRLLTEFESPAYFKFLCECALPEPARARPAPEEDRQMLAVRGALGDYRRSWTIFDYGAGHGDLLAALEAWGDTSIETTYVAATQERSERLERRLTCACKSGTVSASSRLISDLEDAPADCDAIVLCNVCHEVPLHKLPGLLARLLRDHLKRAPSSKLVIHEVEVLGAGEAGYIMWTPDDYRAVFSSVSAVRVDSQVSAFTASVPLHTTVLSWNDRNDPLDTVEADLTRGFIERLPAKRHARLREYVALQRAGASGFSEAIRQRRIAFLIAELASIVIAEEWESAASGRSDFGGSGLEPSST